MNKIIKNPRKKLKNIFLIILVIWIFFTLILFNSLIVGASFLNIKFIEKIQEKLYKHDDGTNNFVVVNEIPMVDYGYKQNQYIGLQINPLSIVRYAEENLTRYKENNSNSEELYRALFLANWLCVNKEIKLGISWENYTTIEFYLWAYNFSIPYSDFNIQRPFYSALAQGHIIKFFEELYLITDNSTYRDHAIYALNAFRAEIRNGGLLIIEDENLFWMPEIAEINYPSHEIFVLGGFMRTIQNMFKLFDLTNSSKIKAFVSILMTNSISNLEDKIALYDFEGVWSYYDRHKNPTSSSYHQLNTEILGWLYNRTSSSVLYEVWISWVTTPHESYPRNFQWYISNYWKLTKIWWYGSIIIFLGFNILVLPVYYVIWKKYARKVAGSEELNKDNSI